MPVAVCAGVCVCVCVRGKIFRDRESRDDEEREEELEAG